MSRFWGGSDSESESEYSDDEEKQLNVKASSASSKAAQAFAYDSSSGSDSDDGRVIKTDKEKKFDAMRATAKSIRNHIKISDWNAIRRDFDLLNEQLEKAAIIVKKEGVPVFYFQTYQAIVDFAEASQATKDKLSATNAKSLNVMRMKLKKIIKPFQQAYDNFVANPPAEVEESSSSSKRKQTSANLSADDEVDWDADSDEDDKKKSKKKSKKDDDSDDEFMSDSDSDSDIDLASGKFTREFWLKKPSASDDDEDTKAEEARAKEEARRKRQEAAEAAKLAQQEKEKEKEKEQQQAPAKPVPQVELKPQEIRNKLSDLIAQRGKKTTDRQAMIEELRNLAFHAKEAGLLLRIKVILTSALLDVNLNSKSAMRAEQWKNAYKSISDIVDQLNANAKVRLAEDDVIDAFAFSSEDGDDNQATATATATAAAAKPAAAAAAANGPVVTDFSLGIVVKDDVEFVPGNLFAFAMRLSDEYFRALQAADPNAPEYVNRIKDEPLLEDLLSKIRTYYSVIGNTRSEALTAQLSLEYAYYKYEAAQDVMATGAAAVASAPAHDVFSAFGTKRSAGADDHIVPKLSTFIYAHGDARAKTRALLCHIYWLSRHNRFHEARDLTLMSHVQDNIILADMQTKILYNRAMTQLGLAAFRQGQIKVAFQTLSELYSTTQTRRLLAQGPFMRYEDRHSEAAKQEQLRQMPFHMHINVDMIDAVHLISAMLLEIPNLAVHPLEDKKYIISKQFRRYLENHLDQPFTAPPENTRDYVVSGALSLMKGDWRKCVASIMALKMWAFVPNSVQVKTMLTRKIQEEGLRSYLLSFSSQYSSLQLSSLEAMFELDRKTIYTLISRLIVNDELAAAWDQPSESLVLLGAEPNSLQQMALRYADKLALLVEQNERLFEPRNDFRAKGDNARRGHSHGWDRDRDNRNGADSSNRGGRRVNRPNYQQRSAANSSRQ